MIDYPSVEFLSQHILTLLDESSSRPMIVLIGGCSRTGKTVLVSKLAENITSSGINATVVKLDVWLISVNNRKQDSTVLDRYEILSIISSIRRVQQGETIYPPVYDVVSRRRITECGIDPIRVRNGILFVEGVIALAITELVEDAALRIFVDIPDELRKQRLMDFYTGMKRLDRKECENIIETREEEEVSLVKETVCNADVIFSGLELK